jgi:hypothetical protein
MKSIYIANLHSVDPSTSESPRSALYGPAAHVASSDGRISHTPLFSIDSTCFSPHDAARRPARDNEESVGAQQ